jgi:hypothetical protein
LSGLVRAVFDLLGLEPHHFIGGVFASPHLCFEQVQNES